MRFILTLLLSNIIFCAFSQVDTFPKDFFRSPVNHQISLSGSFAELRPNHFHAGIDIRPGKSKNYIYAVADGYVSRINIRPTSYGQALYIDHPNGYTSVYAHLSKYSAAVAEYAKGIQHDSLAFEINNYPAAGALKVKKGDIIGVMGNTGRSFGRHLHFEIRDTKTEEPINPLFFGFVATDRKPPIMNGIYAYSMDANHNQLSKKYYPTKKISANRYALSAPVISIPSWRGGLSIRTYDFFDYSTNYNGIYTIEMKINGEVKYKYAADRFSFDETRYLNAHLDYELQQKRQYFHRCFRLPGNHLRMYEVLENDGLFKLYKDEPSKVEIKISDYHGNDVYLEFKVKRSAEIPTPDSPIYNYILEHDSPFNLKHHNFSVKARAGSVYEDLKLRYKTTPSSYSSVKSDIHYLGSDKTPVHYLIEYGIQPNIASERLVAVTISPKGEKKYVVGGMKDGSYVFKLKSLGQFYLKEDITPPTLVKKRFVYEAYTTKSFQFTSVDSEADIADYDAYIDGEWVLMNYDMKNDLLIIPLENSLPKGEHVLEVVVKDGVGNTKRFKSKFKR